MRISGKFTMGAVAAAMLAAACTTGAAGDESVDGVDVEDVISQNQALVGGASWSEVAVGAAVFLHGFPSTKDNGRSCATCHVPGEHFQLSPEHVEARWAALQAKRKKNKNADDPLFRKIDADDPNAATLTYNNLRAGLVRVGMDLPVNVDLVDGNGGAVLPDRKVDLWRSVPTVENVGLVRPASDAAVFQSPLPASDPSVVYATPGVPTPVGKNLEPGFQLDGRVSNLNDQAFGALQGHSEVAANDRPHEKFLTAVASFQKNVFSSFRVAAFAAALEDDPNAAFPEPELDESETRGKGIFQTSCAICHGGASQTQRVGLLPSNYHNIQISKPVPPNAAGALPPPVPLATHWFRTYATDAAGNLVLDANGNKVCIKRAAPNQAQCDDRESTDPGRYLVNGRLTWFNTFDTPQLRGIKNTAPYFHDNSSKTLEDVLVQYDVFFAALPPVQPNGQPNPSKKPIPGPGTQGRADLLAYLNTL